MKILESSQTLLAVLKREATALSKRSVRKRLMRCGRSGESFGMYCEPHNLFNCHIPMPKLLQVGPL